MRLAIIELQENGMGVLKHSAFGLDSLDKRLDRAPLLTVAKIASLVFNRTSYSREWNSVILLPIGLLVAVNGFKSLVPRFCCCLAVSPCIITGGCVSRDVASKGGWYTINDEKERGLRG